jgi:hypothetical protein
MTTLYFPAEERAYWVWVLERGLAAYPGARTALIGLRAAFPGRAGAAVRRPARRAELGLGVREIVVFQPNGALKQFGDDFVRASSPRTRPNLR